LRLKCKYFEQAILLVPFILVWNPTFDDRSKLIERSDDEKTHEIELTVRPQGKQFLPVRADMMRIAPKTPEDLYGTACPGLR
jgi:hypothetical protein